MKEGMKDSGIKWIGEIPEGWKVCKLRNLGHLYGGLSGKSGDDFNINEEVDNFALFIPFTNIWNNQEIDVNQLYKVKIKNGERQNAVNKGDILFLMSSEDYEGLGKTALMNHQIDNLYLNSFCKGFRITKKDIISKFINYLLLSDPIRNIIMCMGHGFIRINLRADNLKNCPVILPPLPEQQEIAGFLDKKCGEIDELVALQEKMIERLKEWKQSIITETVTKGINKNVKMKDSGIQWIGEIPEHWKVCRLKFLCKIFTGDQDTQDAILDGEFPFYVRSPHIERSNHYSYDGESILMAGDGAGAGRVFHHAFGKYAIHQRVYCLSEISPLNTDFLFYYLSNLFINEMDRGSAQSTVPSVRLPMLKYFQVCIPPLPEQQSIAEFLDKKCADVDRLIEMKEKKIEELKEYRQSVIYEYVTGKKRIKSVNFVVDAYNLNASDNQFGIAAEDDADYKSN